MQYQEQLTETQQSEIKLINLVDRFSCLRGYDKLLTSGKIELADVLRRISNGDLRIAESYVAEWIDSNQWAPTPSELREMHGRKVAAKNEYRGMQKPPDWGPVFLIWTDRDVAIHLMLAEEGKTRFAQQYAKKTLEEWACFLEARGASYETPSYVPRPFPHPRCPACGDSNFEYTGPYEVRRCDHRGRRAA